VDSSPWNSAYHASALDFAARNAACAAKTAACLEMVLNNYLPLPFGKNETSHPVVRKLIQKAEAIGQKMREESPIGVMYGICIPKELIDNRETNFVWRSHGWGRPCQHHGHPAAAMETNKAYLESTQANPSTQHCPTCKDLGSPAIIHYRILTAHMGRKEVHTYAVSTFTKAQRKNYRLQMKLLAQEALFYASINNLRENDDGQYFASSYEKFEGQLDQDSVDFVVERRHRFLPEWAIQTMAPRIWEKIQTRRASPPQTGPAVDSATVEAFYSQLENLQAPITAREAGEMFDNCCALKDQLDSQKLQSLVDQKKTYLGEALVDMLLCNLG